MKIQKYYFQKYNAPVEEMNMLIRTEDLMIWSPVYMPPPLGIRPYDYPLNKWASPLLIQCPL